MGQLSDWIIIVCNGLLWSQSGLEYLSTGEFAPTTIYSLNPRQHTPSSDPPQHAGDPPVARHDNLTDDPASLVVVWPRVEATQGLVVAAAVAVTTATVLAAVAVVIQAVIQLDSNVSLQRTQQWAGLQSHTHDKCQSSQGKGRRRRKKKKRKGWCGLMSLFCL